MPYYVRHHFDPDFDYNRLSPRERADGGVDHYDLGYVQNVAQGQLLAEIVDMEDAGPEMDKRFVLEYPVFPAGANTRVDPANERRLLAAVSGYVFRADGLIHVHDLLNVRRHVDFHTGNITFPGNIVVHGSVRSGFVLEARNIKVLGIIGGAELKAGGSILAHGGIKGQKKAVLTARWDIQAAFSENARITAGRNIRVDGAAMHCHCATGKNMLVGGRLQGGKTIVGRKLLVRGQLGGGMGTTTTIVLGQEPRVFLGLEKVEEELLDIDERLDYYGEQITFGPGLAHDYGVKIEQTNRRKRLLERKRDELIEAMERAPRDSEAHQIVAAGGIRPGVVVTLGASSLVVDDTYGPSRIRLDAEGRLALFDHTPAES
jgi:uncharacterized protein (DUF342 family)